MTAGLDVQTSTNDMFAYQDLVDSGTSSAYAFSTGPGVFRQQLQSMEEVKGVLTNTENITAHNIKAISWATASSASLWCKRRKNWK